MKGVFVRSNSLSSPRRPAHPLLQQFNNVHGGAVEFALTAELEEGDVQRWSGDYHHSSETRPITRTVISAKNIYVCHTAQTDKLGSMRPNTPPRSDTPSFFSRATTPSLSSTGFKGPSTNIATTPQNRADTPPPSATPHQIDEKLDSHRSLSSPELLDENGLPIGFVDTDTALRLVDSNGDNSPNSDEDEERRYVTKEKPTLRALLWSKPLSTRKPKSSSSEQHVDPNDITIAT